MLMRLKKFQCFVSVLFHDVRRALVTKNRNFQRSSFPALQGGPKSKPQFVVHSSSNIDQFSIFYRYILWKICNKLVIE